ncbi:MAG: putative lipid II flippase FtsW [Candidatus Pacebacteria bacterium]|nr:putative lipid II flippase FtsW [Candidatus Paceibacterota bacterium]
MLGLKNFFKKITKEGKGAHKPDKPLIIAVIIALVFGLLMLASASAVVAYIKFENSYYYLEKQLLFTLVGLFFLFIFSKINYRFWRKNALYFLLGSIVFLILVFIPGLRANYGSASSWIEIFGFSLQPSEFVKLSFLIYLAAWLEAKQSQVKDAHQVFWPFLIILGVIAFLMYKQPDLGTLSIIAFSSLVVIFVSGVKKRLLIGFVIVIALLGYGIVSTNEYQANRFKCMQDPSFSPRYICYQINQSLIAVGSGGLEGRGLGESRQKFLYLPEVSADAIFPIISEEIGFIFSLLFISLFIFIFYRGIIISKKIDDNFGSLLSLGIVTWIIIQVFLNIGGMIALVPMTGVPLPFVSAGGSSIIALLMAMGILINISKYARDR